MTGGSFYDEFELDWQISESRMRYTGQHHLMSDLGRVLWYTILKHNYLKVRTIR